MSKKIFKITETEVIERAKRYFILKKEYEKAMDERRYDEARSLLWKKGNTLFNLELDFDKIIRERRAEEIKYQMSYERDYEYFLEQNPPYILVRKEVNK